MMSRISVRQDLAVEVFDGGLSLSRYEVTAAQAPVTVGGAVDRREQDNYVFVPIAGLSSELFRCTFTNGEWMIRADRDLPTRAGEKIPAFRDTPVSNGVEIPLSPDCRVAVRTRERRLAAQGEETIQSLTLADIEATVLDELIAYREHERDAFIGMSEARQLELMSDYLDASLSRRFSSLTNEQLLTLASECGTRELVYRCIASGGDKPLSRNYSAMLTEERKTYERLLDHLLGKMNLPLLPAETETNIHRIREDAAERFEIEAKALGRHMMIRIVFDTIRQQIFSLFFGFGPLQELLDIGAISEIMVVRHDQVFVAKSGRLFDTKLDFTSETQLRVLAGKILARANLAVTEGEPYQDARLPDGSRVNVVIPPIALKGTTLTIRKFGERRWILDDLVAFGSMSHTMRRFLVACVKARKNIVVSGGTDSGKTTLLNALAAEIPADERLVTIEDTAELRLPQTHVVTLQSRPPSPDGKGQVTIRDLVANALRMRPDRLIIGECRRGEALDMLQAMNTGHDGSMTTTHANSPQHLMTRLETLAMQADIEIPSHAIRQQIVGAIDIVVQAAKVGGAYRVTEIAEVVAIDPETDAILVDPVFRLVGGREGTHMLSGFTPTFLTDLIEEGLIDLDTFLSSDDSACRTGA